MAPNLILLRGWNDRHGNGPWNSGMAAVYSIDDNPPRYVRHLFLGHRDRLYNLSQTNILLIPIVIHIHTPLTRDFDTRLMTLLTLFAQDKSQLLPVPPEHYRSVKLVCELVSMTYVLPLMGGYPFGVGTVALKPPSFGRRFAGVETGPARVKKAA